MEQRKYPVGVQDFESLRKDCYLYVDKTAIIHDIVSRGRYYFLSRPRRFGKSLLISTLKAYFEGKRELFQGLAMERLEQEWKEYPVLRLDLNAERYVQSGELENVLDTQLREWESMYGSTEQGNSSLSIR